VFNKMHLEDRMANENLRDGIDSFTKALEQLEHLLSARLLELA
jgi:transaldolase